MLKALQEQDQPLRLEHFHRHWHLSRTGSPQLLLEPRQPIDRISDNSAKPQSSIRREPSAFEAVEVATQPRAQPKCSRCHAIGHRMTSKSCPLQHAELLQPEAIEAPAATETLVAMAVPPAAAVARALPYDDPQPIYQRCTAAGEAWYKAQAPGSIKTNQQYRKAMGLPFR
jgi:hypothetical protein